MNQTAKRVLIVVSSYRPAMLADMQRARMLAWELPKLGWEVEILTPDSNEVRQDALEPDLTGFFPGKTPVHTVRSFGRAFFHAIGSNTPTLRTLVPMRRRGSQLLRSSRFDLIYFSTTTFSYFSLGPFWRRKFGVPYVLDFQDPWVKGDSGKLSRVRRKDRVAQWLFRRWERRAVTNAAGLIAVSPEYLDLLQQRYGASKPEWLNDKRHTVIPFGALPSDLQEARKSARSDLPRQQTEIALHYVGAGGAIMSRSFLLICRALVNLRAKNNPLIDSVRMRLFGTTSGWRAGDPKALENVARAAGVGDLVAEYPERVSYRRSLELLLESNGVLVLGVDERGYMPSKLFSYALSGKPLLASLHYASPALAELHRFPTLGHALWFDRSAEMAEAEAAEILQRYLHEASARRSFDRRDVLRPFLASAMACRHVELFTSCLNES